MVEDVVEIPFLRNIGLFLTYRCQVACQHCVVEAGPHRSEEVSLDVAVGWLHDIAKYRNGYVRAVGFTGGEPFYDIAKLRILAELAETLGLAASAVTNAFWASDRETAMHVLQSLRAVKMLSISTDVYHQQAIPFERVANAIAAAEEFCVPYTVAVCTDSKADPGYLAVISDLERITSPDRILTALTFMAGRAASPGHPPGLAYSTEPSARACTAGSCPIIFPDGRVIGCVGPVIQLKSRQPLDLGNLWDDTLAHILDAAERNPILHAIRIWGPGDLVRRARKAGLERALPDAFVAESPCDACYQLMAEPSTVSFLEDLAGQPDFVRQVAYARAYYLGEIEMVRAIGLA